MKNKNKHYNGNMNGSKNNVIGNPTFWGILGIVVITCFDLATRRGYRVKGGGSVGTGKHKKSGWIDCEPGKGGRK